MTEKPIETKTTSEIWSMVSGISPRCCWLEVEKPEQNILWVRKEAHDAEMAKLIGRLQEQGNTNKRVKKLEAQIAEVELFKKNLKQKLRDFFQEFDKWYDPLPIPLEDVEKGHEIRESLIVILDSVEQTVPAKERKQHE